MTIKTKQELLTELTGNFPDNVAGAITAEIFRNFLSNVLDSYPETVKTIDKTVSFSLGAQTDLSTMFVCDSVTGMVASLVDAVLYPNGFFCFFRAVGPGLVSVAASGADTINGETTVQINQNGAIYLLFLSSSSTWIFSPVAPNFDYLKFIYGTTSGDDQGIIIQNGQFSVGSPDDPRESVFGSGDSYPVPVAYHCNAANTSGLDISSAVNVTDILQSDNASSTGLFDGIVAGKYLLIGSDYKFSGVKAKIDTLGTIDPDNIQGFYLKSDTPEWVESEYMVTNADYPYNQNGRNIACCVSKSEQWRFGSDPNDPIPVWDKVELTINGVPITKYWAKIELIGGIVLDPLIEQMKLHTNRCEINADGTTEYFGAARYPKSLVFGLQNTIPNNKYNPADQIVDYSPNFSAGYVNNKFANTVVDGFALLQPIEVGLDTSIPLQLFVSYYVDGINTGDIDFTVEVNKIADDFVYDGTATPDVYEKIDTVDVASDHVRRTVSFNISVADLFPNDAIVLNIFRDATVPNTDDTLQTGIVITNVSLIGVFWRP